MVPLMQHLLKVITFWVKVPVLSEKMYSTWPSWSPRLALLACAGASFSGQYISRSQLMKKLFTRETNSNLWQQEGESMGKRSPGSRPGRPWESNREERAEGAAHRHCCLGAARELSSPGGSHKQLP